MKRYKAILFDRDGTINPDPGYINNPDDFQLYPEVPRLLAQLKKAGYLLVLVTNQSGVGRGLIKPGNLCLIHRKMQNQLREHNAEFDRIFVCPHAPAAAGSPSCDCRKPSPGLALKAIRELKLAPKKCFVIGDRITDVKMAAGAGIPAVLIGEIRPDSDLPFTLVPTLAAAVRHVLKAGT